jgi:DNA-binding response OmpR family regulator
LIVEDSADLRELWNLWLSTHGFSVLEAENGVEALRQAQKTPPDLVLLDVMMPVLDGLETLKRLRAQETTSTVPVIMMSAQGEAAERAARDLRADVFMPKPVHPDVLMQHIRSLLQRG